MTVGLPPSDPDLIGPPDDGFPWLFAFATWAAFVIVGAAAAAIVATLV